MNGFVTWMVGSTYFKKYLGVLGGFALGYLTAMTYWRQVNATLEVWGVEREAFRSFLIAVVGATCVVGSQVLSMVKAQREKRGGRR
jgi:ABC-type Fe3+ transport system permease subunit